MGLLLVLGTLPALAQRTMRNNNNTPPSELQVLEQAAQEVSTQILASPKVKGLTGATMVVAPLCLLPPIEDYNIENRAAQILQIKLAAAFINNGGEQVQVVDQVVVEKAMQDLKLDVEGIADPINWRALGGKMGVRCILLGTFALTGNEFSLDARLVDLESKQALGAGGALGRLNRQIAADAGLPDNMLVVAEWALPGFTKGQLIEPTGLALDKAGNIYVTEARRAVVQKFDAKGKLLQEWGAEPGAGKLQHPTGVAVDPQGRVIVTDFLNPGSCVQIYSGDGKLQQSWTKIEGDARGFQYLSGVTVDRAGNIYLIDRLANRAVRLAGNGMPIKWKVGDREGIGFDVDAPTQITLNLKDEMYIANGAGGSVWHAANDGTYINGWGAIDDTPDLVKSPRGLAVSAEGNVFLIDDGEKPNRLQEFTADGKVLQTIRLLFGPVSALAINAQGQLIVATRLDGKVRVVELLRK